MKPKPTKGAKKRTPRVATAKTPRRGRAWRAVPTPSAATNEPYAQIRRICLGLPDTGEKIAWGRPTFRVREKLFVMFMDNHHDDGRVAIWCAAPPGVQKALVATDAEHFFVPPYVGVRGWLGVHLNRGLDWARIADLVDDAYRTIATGPPSLSR